MPEAYRKASGRPVGALGAGLALLRWLGPWADERAAPRIQRDPIAIPPRGDAAGFTAWLYRPRARPPRRVYLLAPGLHFAGPGDPRMDRFCAILAGSGAAVLAPFLPDFGGLVVTPRVIVDLERTFDHLATLALAPVKPAVFSISFGSLPALRLAARRPGELGALIVFGGYADFAATMRFCLTGEIDGGRDSPRDPLNQPVVFMNLLHLMPEAPADRAALMAGWRRYVRATWGRAEMKAPARFHAACAEVSASLPAATREFFALGCGVIPGGYEVCRAALARMGEESRFLDPRPHLEAISCPVELIHGATDDVIPYEQAELLRAALPAAARPRVHVTGLYGHTGRSGLALATAARELATLGRVLRVLARGGG